MGTVKPVGYIQMNDTGCQSINPPEFPKYPAGIVDAMSHEHLWDYACLTGWRTGHFLQPDSERDAAPQTTALAVERASKLLLLYEMQLTTLQPPLRERVAAMIEAMKGMGL